MQNALIVHIPQKNTVCFPPSPPLALGQTDIEDEVWETSTDLTDLKLFCIH